MGGIVPVDSLGSLDPWIPIDPLGSVGVHALDPSGHNSTKVPKGFASYILYIIGHDNW
jgi:hypothetical protein